LFARGEEAAEQAAVRVGWHADAVHLIPYSITRVKTTTSLAAACVNLFFENGGVQKVYWDTYYNELLSAFSVSQVMTDYGPPDEVLILPFPDAPFSSVIALPIFMPKKP